MAKLLLVEDDPMMRSLLALKLRRHGWDVEEAGNGLEALLATEATRFDLVITDISLPEMDGRELLSRLKGRDPALRVIGITADSGALGELRALGFDRILEKPIEEEHLLALDALQNP